MEYTDEELLEIVSKRQLSMFKNYIILFKRMEKSGIILSHRAVYIQIGKIPGENPDPDIINGLKLASQIPSSQYLRAYRKLTGEKPTKNQYHKPKKAKKIKQNVRVEPPKIQHPKSKKAKKIKQNAQVKPPKTQHPKSKKAKKIKQNAQVKPPKIQPKKSKKIKQNKPPVRILNPVKSNREIPKLTEQITKAELIEILHPFTKRTEGKSKYYPTLAEHYNKAISMRPDELLDYWWVDKNRLATLKGFYLVYKHVNNL